MNQPAYIIFYFECAGQRCAVAVCCPHIKNKDNLKAFFGVVKYRNRPKY